MQMYKYCVRVCMCIHIIYIDMYENLYTAREKKQYTY